MRKGTRPTMRIWERFSKTQNQMLSPLQILTQKSKLSCHSSFLYGNSLSDWAGRQIRESGAALSKQWIINNIPTFLEYLTITHQTKKSRRDYVLTDRMCKASVWSGHRLAYVSIGFGKNLYYKTQNTEFSIFYTLQTDYVNVVYK